MNTITILGGGFSGIMTAVNLMRNCKRKVDIMIINKGHQFARGSAYSTNEDGYFLNVRAMNMSAFPDEPDHFVNWLSDQEAYADLPADQISQLFVPRKAYGDYLEELFNIEKIKFRLQGKGSILMIHKEAAAIAQHESGYVITLSDGAELVSSFLVIATGNSSPALPGELYNLHQHDRYISNPWEKLPPSLLQDSNADVLFIGSGLTMADLALKLRDANWKGTMYTVSRNGLLPARHHQQRTFRVLDNQDFISNTLHEALTIYKQLHEQAVDEGSDPLLVLDQFRPVTQHLWRHFSIKDRKRFLHFFQSKWNVARHKLPDTIYQQLDDLQARRQLKWLKGKVASAEIGKNFFVIKIKNENNVQYLAARYIINCTGSPYHVTKNESLLWKNLLEKSFVQPDPLGMGLMVNDKLQTIGKAGVNHNLYALGAVVRGTFWECVTVPELRIQAKEIAASLLEYLIEEKAMLEPAVI